MVTPANLTLRNWATATNSSYLIMPSLISASNSSTVHRLTNQTTTAISNIDVRSPSVTAITPHVPHADNLMVPFDATVTPANSKIIFNAAGEQAWHFKDHVC